MLREACEEDESPIDVAQAVQLLQAAGLVGVSGSVHADPLQIHPIASIINLPARRATDADPADRLDADIAIVLAQLHRFGRDFHGSSALLEEQVFSSLLAVALTSLGWPAIVRETVQAAGYLDLRVQMTKDGHEHAVIEVKIWPRNDYKDIQTQLDAYRVSATHHAVAVTLGERSSIGWADEYERKCLTGGVIVRRSTPPDLVGCWRVETANQQQTTHFLVQVPKRT